MTSTYLPGEIVDITIRGARVVQHHQPDDQPHELTFTEANSGVEVTVLVPWTGNAVERVAPPEWPPRPGDLWRSAAGILYFAVRYTPDYDNRADCEGIDDSGARVLLVSQYEEYGGLGAPEFRPDHVNRQYGPLTDSCPGVISGRSTGTTWVGSSITERRMSAERRPSGCRTWSPSGIRSGGAQRLPVCSCRRCHHIAPHLHVGGGPAAIARWGRPPGGGPLTAAPPGLGGVRQVPPARARRYPTAPQTGE